MCTGMESASRQISLSPSASLPTTMATPPVRSASVYATGAIPERHPAHQLRADRDDAATPHRRGMQGTSRLHAGLVQQLLGHEQLPEPDSRRDGPVDLPGPIDEHQPPEASLPGGAQAEG